MNDVSFHQHGHDLLPRRTSLLNAQFDISEKKLSLKSKSYSVALGITALKESYRSVKERDWPSRWLSLCSLIFPFFQIGTDWNVYARQPRVTLLYWMPSPLQLSIVLAMYGSARNSSVRLAAKAQLILGKFDLPGMTMINLILQVDMSLWHSTRTEIWTIRLQCLILLSLMWSQKTPV